MGIGLGVVLLVAGLILVLDVLEFDIAGVEDNTLGLILLIVGALTIVLALVVNHQRTRTRVVETRRHDEPL